MIPTYTRAMDLSDETEEKPRRPEMDAWTRVRLGDYADSILSSAVDRDVLVDRLALALPHFLAELRRVTDPEQEQIPVPLAAGQAVAGVASASDDDGAPHPAPLSVVTASRVETLEALAKMIDAAPKAWSARRALIAGPIADGVQALQEAGTSPDVLVRDVLSMLRLQDPLEAKRYQYAHFYRLAPYLRRMLEEVPEPQRVDTWDRALFVVIDVLDDAVVYLPEREGVIYPRRMVIYCHEVLCRVARYSMPIELLRKVVVRYERALQSGFPPDASESLHRNLLLIEVKLASERGGLGSDERLALLPPLLPAADYAVVAKAISALAPIIWKMPGGEATKALVLIADVALLLGTPQARPCRQDIQRLQSMIPPEVIFAPVRALLSALVIELVADTLSLASASIERLFRGLADLPPAMRDGLPRELLSSLAAKLADLSPQMPENLSRHVRTLNLRLEDFWPERSLAEVQALLTDRLADLVAGSPLTGPHVDRVVFALRAALEQMFSADDLAAATREVSAFIAELIALPDDPRALVATLYGPYLEDGLAAGEEILPRDEWQRLVAEASGADLPADLAEGLRVCFSGKASG